MMVVCPEENPSSRSAGEYRAVMLGQADSCASGLLAASSPPPTEALGACPSLLAPVMYVTHTVVLKRSETESA